VPRRQVPVVELQFQKLGFRPQDNDEAARACKYVNISYGYYDKLLAKQPWLCGENFTMADCAAIPALYHAQTVIPFDAHSNVVAYWQRVLRRPS
jgi:glutathione S-transferase